MEALWSSLGIEILNGKKRLTLLGSGERDRRLHRNLLQPAKPKFTDRLCVADQVRVTFRGSTRFGVIMPHGVTIGRGDESWG